MSPLGEYEPSPYGWVRREQAAEYEASGGRRANTLLDTGLPIIVVTTRGNKTGKLRKTPLMRVEHGGEYALVASQGGLPKHPVWHQPQGRPGGSDDPGRPDALRRPRPRAHGRRPGHVVDRAVAAYPPYAEYQQRTERQISSRGETPRRRSSVSETERQSRWSELHEPAAQPTGPAGFGTSSVSGEGSSPALSAARTRRRAAGGILQRGVPAAYLGLRGAMFVGGWKQLPRPSA